MKLRTLLAGALAAGSVSLGLTGAAPAQAAAAPPALQIVDLVDTIKIRQDGAIALPASYARCSTAYNGRYNGYHSYLYVTAKVTQVINGRVRSATGTRYLACKGHQQYFDVSTSPANGQPAWRVGPTMAVVLTFTGHYHDPNGTAHDVVRERRETGLRTVRG